MSQKWFSEVVIISSEALKLFFTRFKLYERDNTLGNNGQSTQRYCLSVAELLFNFVWSCLSCQYSDESRLVGFLWGFHERRRILGWQFHEFVFCCTYWKKSCRDEIWAHGVTVSGYSESATETLVGSDDTKKAFCGDANEYQPDPTRAITTAFSVAGLHSPKFMSKVVTLSRMTSQILSTVFRGLYSKVFTAPTSILLSVPLVLTVPKRIVTPILLWE